MSKKSRRPIRKETIPATEKLGSSNLASNRPAAFNPDYHYVTRDIRRVGILAGSFIIVLIALSFFLH